MKHTDALYRTTAFADYLELICDDGTYRGVMFKTPSAAMEAMQPGRAELDCWAIWQGFLPRGATLVSSPGVLRDAFEENGDGLAEAQNKALNALHVSGDSDRAARARFPAAAERYDAMSMPHPLSE